MYYQRQGIMPGFKLFLPSFIRKSGDILNKIPDTAFYKSKVIKNKIPGVETPG
jgi:hypothetical protein